MGIFNEGLGIDHNGYPLLVERSLSSGLTGEVYKGKLSRPDGSQVDVAIKVMKDLGFESALQNFHMEGQTLALLSRLEEESQDPLDRSLKIAPVYYGMNSYQAVPGEPSVTYFVMEFITGQEIPKILGSGRLLDEKQTLVVGWHLYRIFHFLHVRLKKTYLDLKYEDLWWVEKDNIWEGQLKLTDFGTLEEIRGDDRSGIARDLLLGGVYLLSMITGRTMDFSLGEIKEAAAPVINEFAGNYSEGTRSLLLKLLHRNSAARSQSAEEVRDEIRGLLNYWRLDEGLLAGRIARDLDRAEEEYNKSVNQNVALSVEGKNAAASAFNALDIQRIRFPQRDNTADIDRAKTILALGSYFDRGQRFLQGRSYSLARRSFEEGMAWDASPAAMRRWSYVARIAETTPTADFEARFSEVKSLLDFINDSAPHANRWQPAVRDLENLKKSNLGKPGIDSDGLNYLIAECKLFRDLEAAYLAFHQEDFRRAAELFDSVDSLIQQTPKEMIQSVQEETGNTQAIRRTAELNTAMQASKELFQQAMLLLEKKEVARAIETARLAYAKYTPASGSYIREKALADLATKALLLATQDRDHFPGLIRAAKQFIDIGIIFFPADVAFTEITIGVVQINKAYDLLLIGEQDGFCDALKRAYPALGKYGIVVFHLANHAAGIAEKNADASFLRALDVTITGLVVSLPPNRPDWRAQAASIETAQVAERHKAVDVAISRVHFAMSPLTAYNIKGASLEEYFRKAEEWSSTLSALDIFSLGSQLQLLEQAYFELHKVDQILAKGDDYRQDEINRLRASLSNSIGMAKKAAASQTQLEVAEYERRLEELLNERVKLEQELNWVLSGKDLDIDKKYTEGLYDNLRKKLLDFLYRCYQFKTAHKQVRITQLDQHQDATQLGMDASIAPMIHWATGMLGLLGAEGWQWVREVSTENENRIKAEFAQVKQAFEDGKLDIVAAELDRTQPALGGTPEWKRLKASLARVQAWMGYCDKYSNDFESYFFKNERLRDIRDFSKHDLPLLYFNQSPAFTYLGNVQSELARTIRAEKDLTTNQGFELIKQFLEVTWTKKIFAGSNRADMKRQEWLKEAYSFAKKNDSAGLIGFIGQALPPATESIEQNLRDMTINLWLGLRSQQEAHINNGDGGPGVDLNTKILIMVAGGLAVILMLMIAAFAFYKMQPDTFMQMIGGTYTPTPTQTPVPTSTPMPTPLPPTEAPSPEPTQPIPVSTLLLADPVVVYPKVPVIGLQYWVVNDSSAVFEPALAEQGPWKTGATEDNQATTKETLYYANSGPASVTWNMDVPFQEGGFYAVYVLDSSKKSEGLQKFEVSLNDVVIPPDRGSAEVMLKTEQQNPNDSWLNIGYYKIQVGQKMSIRVALQNLSEKQAFTADRILIVRLSDINAQMLESLPTGRTLVSLLDDTSLNYYEISDRKPILSQMKDKKLQQNDAISWNGGFSSLINSLEAPVWVEWTADNVVRAGEYEVLVWIPAFHATAPVAYDFMADGQPVTRESPAKINQTDYQGAWVTLGTWKLDRDAAVGLRLMVERGMNTEVGIDAAAFLQVNP